jgi:hypothetical protein
MLNETVRKGKDPPLKAASKREKESLSKPHRCTSWQCAKIKFKTGVLLASQQEVAAEGAPALFNSLALWSGIILGVILQSNTSSEKNRTACIVISSNPKCSPHLLAKQVFPPIISVDPGNWL